MFILGVILFLKKDKLQTDTPGISFMIIGGFMSVILILILVNLPSQSEFDEMNYVLFHSPPSIFESIEVSTYTDYEYVRKRTLELFKDPYIKISDPNEIERIVLALRTAKKFSVNHPGFAWALSLTLNSNIKNLTITVRNTKSKRNGVYFDFIGYGHMRCDKIGVVLENILLKKSKN